MTDPAIAALPRAALRSVIALILLALACGSSPATDRPARLVADPAVDAGAEPEGAADYSDENSVGMSDERVGRWRWQGSRKRCRYVVDNRCFATEAEACEAAGCADARCRVANSAPARVSCENS
jgi:hypothetical protein